jgi:H+/Cl- antiporter ClcA
VDKLRYVIAAVAIGAVLLIIYFLKPGVIRFKSFSAAEFVQQLTPLVLAALFIERSLEVFLNVWRGGQEAKLERAIEKAKQKAAVNQATIVEVHNAEDALSDYRFSTQQIAIPASLILGILLSALGIRGLGALLDLVEFKKLSESQQTWVNIADVLLTGALIGGGSDFMHKVITTFTDLMDATSRKATGQTV